MLERLSIFISIIYITLPMLECLYCSVLFSLTHPHDEFIMQWRVQRGFRGFTRTDELPFDTKLFYFVIFHGD